MSLGEECCRLRLWVWVWAGRRCRETVGKQEQGGGLHGEPVPLLFLHPHPYTLLLTFRPQLGGPLTSAPTTLGLFLPPRHAGKGRSPATGAATPTSAPPLGLSKPTQGHTQALRPGPWHCLGHSSPAQVQTTSFGPTSTTQPQPPHSVSVRGIGIFHDLDASTRCPLRPPALGCFLSPTEPPPVASSSRPWHTHRARAADT